MLTMLLCVMGTVLFAPPKRALSIMSDESMIREAQRERDCALAQILSDYNRQLNRAIAHSDSIDYLRALELYRSRKSEILAQFFVLAEIERERSRKLAVKLPPILSISGLRSRDPRVKR